MVKGSINATGGIEIENDIVNPSGNNNSYVLTVGGDIGGIVSLKNVESNTSSPTLIIEGSVKNTYIPEKDEVVCSEDSNCAALQI